MFSDDPTGQSCVKCGKEADHAIPYGNGSTYFYFCDEDKPDPVKTEVTNNSTPDLEDYGDINTELV